MSRLNLNQIRLGSNIDPTKNFIIKIPDTGADGTLSIQRENGTPVLNIDAAGKIVSSGDIELSGSARKIRGDFSNTNIANRTMFQTSTVDGITSLTVIPNNTGNFSQVSLNSSSDPNNYSLFDMSVSGVGVARLRSLGVGSAAALPITFETGGAERMRIQTNGEIFFGKTTNVFSVVGVAVEAAKTIHITTDSTKPLALNRLGSDGAIAEFYKATLGPVGFISVTGSATSYNTTSDYRLKENIAPIADHFQKIQALKPVTYSWKVDGSAGRGFIAHELQEVFPLAVTGQKDELDEEGKPKYQAMDASFIIADLVACVQDLKKELDSVKQELAALKGA